MRRAASYGGLGGDGFASFFAAADISAALTGVSFKTGLV